MTEETLNYDFDPEKNLKLKRERGISFEEVITAIEEGHLIDVIDHPNAEKFKHQKIYVVEIEGYVYLVPYVESAPDYYFLKTVIPSRKASRDYLFKEL